MSREIELNDVPDILEQLEYPAKRSEAAAALDDIDLMLPDISVNLGDAVKEIPYEYFVSAGELEVESLRVVALHSVRKSAETVK